MLSHLPIFSANVPGSSPSQSLPLSLDQCSPPYLSHVTAFSPHVTLLPVGGTTYPAATSTLSFALPFSMVLPEQLESTTLNPLFSSFQTPSLLFTRDYQSPLLRHVRQSLRILASSVSPHLSLAFLFVKIQSDLPGPEQMLLPPGSLPPPLASPEAVSLAFRGRCWQFALL